MKKMVKSAVVFALACFALTACNDKRKPGSIYVPDMAYSRGYETYAERNSKLFTSNISELGGKIFYNNLPVAGTIKRGCNIDMPYWDTAYQNNETIFPYVLTNDSTGYKLSDTIKNPLTALTDAELNESQRLFNINCAVCHGEKGDAAGPVAGKVGGVANLTQEAYVKMTDGKMFHSITYGKNLMGSYASQLNAKQRWMVVKYIRTLQPAPASDSAKVQADKKTETAGNP
jgi:mono/diheme cytochrome c family protein